MTTEGMSEEEKKAVKKAMDLLLHKDRTRQELRERLEKQDFPGRQKRQPWRM